MKKLLPLFILTLLLVNCNFSNKEKVVFQKTYHKNGKLFEEIPIVNGKAHGLKKEYYDNGAIRLEVPYSDGLIQGTVKFYHPDGKLYSETPRVDGKIEGIVKKYHENGNILSETPYSNNTLLPGLKEWDEKGTLMDNYDLKFTLTQQKQGQNLRGELSIDVFPSIKQAKYYQLIDYDSLKTNYAAIPTTNKTGFLLVSLPKGATLNTTIKVKSEFVTRYNNRGVIYGQYQLLINN
jgi:hypothetical protein